ncbi:hypothetical protein BH09BAC1_BH09BAC1_04670 [soil metagenome]
MRTIDITTTQNVTIQYELADLKDRFFAWLIDVVIWVVFILFLLILFYSFSPTDRVDTYFWYVVVIPVVLFYTLFSEILLNGQTLGKKALKLRVVKLNGRQPSLSDYLFRWAFRGLDIYFSLGALAAVLVSSSQRAQRMGDLVSNTVVVRIIPQLSFQLTDIMRINTLENYEPKYPEVKRFSEEDMLLVKQTIERARRYPNEAHRKAINLMVQKLSDQMGTQPPTSDYLGFLRTLVSDYIVLTR